MTQVISRPTCVVSDYKTLVDTCAAAKTRRVAIDLLGRMGNGGLAKSILGSEAWRAITRVDKVKAHHGARP